jgi:hypothetical protein
MSNNDEIGVKQDVDTESQPPGQEMSRRDALQLLATLPLAAFLRWPTAEQEKVRSYVDDALRAAADGTL